MDSYILILDWETEYFQDGISFLIIYEFSVFLINILASDFMEQIIIQKFIWKMKRPGQ